MSDLVATPEHLHECGAALASIGGALHPQFAELSRTTGRLLGADWTGGAASGFRQGWVDWHRGATEALAALEELARLLGAGGTIYRGTDDTARAQVLTTEADR